MRTQGNLPITFAEWGYLGKGKFQRRDFCLRDLTMSSVYSEKGSLFADLGTQEFVRVRLGIGRPPPRMEGADYVLQNFSRAEAKELPFLLGEAADAVELILQTGLTSAMNRFNPKPAEADEE